MNYCDALFHVLVTDFRADFLVSVRANMTIFLVELFEIVHVLGSFD